MVLEKHYNVKYFLFLTYTLQILKIQNDETLEQLFLFFRIPIFVIFQDFTLFDKTCTNLYYQRALALFSVDFLVNI